MSQSGRLYIAQIQCWEYLDCCRRPSIMPDPEPAPQRILRRAANILASKGVKELVFTPPEPPKRRPSRLGSMKQKFKEVRGVLLRSKSTSETPSSALTPAQRHTRTQSAVFARSNTVPLGHNRFSLQTMTSPIETTANPLPSTDRTGNHAATDITVPELLQRGTPMTKVSSTKQKKYMFRVDADQGQIVYLSSKEKIGAYSHCSPCLFHLIDTLVPIETIREMRFGADARYDREQFQISQQYEPRWITLIYILDGNYKTLHLIAPTQDVFNMWNVTLQQLHAIRQELMTGLGNVEMRQALWEKHYWKGADEEKDQKLEFSEVEKLCRRLNINSSSDDLRRLFKVLRSVHSLSSFDMLYLPASRHPQSKLPRFR